MNPIDAFDRILASLHQAALDDAHWPVTAALIDQACGAAGNALMVGEGSGDDERVLFGQFLYRGESRPDLAREYAEVYYPDDEAPRRLRELPAGRLFPTSDLYTEEQLKALFSVNYFCRLTATIFAGSARRGSRSRSAASGESSWTAGTPPSRPGRKAHNCHPSRGAGGVSPAGP